MSVKCDCVQSYDVKCTATIFFGSRCSIPMLPVLMYVLCLSVPYIRFDLFTDIIHDEIVVGAVALTNWLLRSSPATIAQCIPSMSMQYSVGFCIAHEF